MRKEKRTVTGNELVLKSKYYSMFIPGGKYHDEFMDVLEKWRDEKEVLWLGVVFASLGFICGKREERARKRK